VEQIVPDEGAPRVVQLSGELGLAEAARLRAQLLDVISETSERVVIVDLSDVAFLDSTAIGVIIGARKRLLTQGRQLWLAGPSDTAYRTLRTLSLDKLIPTFVTLDEATATAADAQVVPDNEG
jgi:anti-sigma B factor antagonist